MNHEHIKALDKLIAAVESGGDAIQHNIYIKAAHAFTPESAYGKCPFYEVPHAFYGSLDAAKALHDALLPGWRVSMMEQSDQFGVGVAEDGIWHAMISSTNANPARAWLIAILKAYRSTLST